MTTYSSRFYARRHAGTVYSAEQILKHLFKVIPCPKSIVDIGCGVGTWLAVGQQLGVKEIQGIDGPWVDKDMLEIPPENVCHQDLTSPINLNKRFDLAISLEVAEHLPKTYASQFVSALTELSDFILFAAAVPYQGGTGHINEQWPNYWVTHFQDRGYVALDVIRKHIWQDAEVPQWYRQNTLLYVKKNRISDLNISIEDVLNAAAPENYLLYYHKLVEPGIRQSFFSLAKAIKRKILG